MINRIRPVKYNQYPRGFKNCHMTRTSHLPATTVVYHKYVNYDHPGESSPEKDCLG